MDIIRCAAKKNNTVAIRQGLLHCVFVLVFMLTTLLSGCGGGASSSEDTPVGTLSLLAGNTLGAGNVDGKGAAASFYWPYGVAVASDGTVYVADSANNKIRKIMHDGTVTTLAGSGQAGSNDGVGIDASFNGPMGIAVGNDGAVYVVDTGNYTIRMITPDGKVTTLAGTPGVLGDQDTGTGASPAQARFGYALGIAVDANGSYLYVADSANNKIRKVSIADGEVTTLAGSGAEGDVDASGELAQFDNPAGIAVDAVGNVYVADGSNYKIRKVTAGGVVTTLAGSGVYGHDDGVGTMATFAAPSGLAVAGDALYVVSQGDDLIRKVALSDGAVTTWAGSRSATDSSGSTDGAGAQARFNSPAGIAADANGTVFYVADTENHTIRKIVPKGSDILVSTLAGSAPECRSDGALCGVSSIAVAADGAIYATTSSQISVLTLAGVVSRLAGSNAWGCADGFGVVASFRGLADIAVGSDGFIYVADAFNNSIRKVSPEGTVTTPVSLLSSGAGTSLCGGIASVFLGKPMGLAVGADGTIYIADTSDNTILKVVNGVVGGALAGSFGVKGNADGAGTEASFSSPRDIVMGADGNLYVADSGNSRIRKITPDGVVSTLAGSTPGYADGVGTVAKFNFPEGLAVDGAGNLFVADTNNDLIRKVTPAGRVTTVAGAFDKMGITLGKLPATLARPSDVAIDSAGRLLITSDNAILVAEKPGGF